MSADSSSTFASSFLGQLFAFFLKPVPDQNLSIRAPVSLMFLNTVKACGIDIIPRHKHRYASNLVGNVLVCFSKLQTKTSHRMHRFQWCSSTRKNFVGLLPSPDIGTGMHQIHSENVSAFFSETVPDQNFFMRAPVFIGVPLRREALWLL